MVIWKSPLFQSILGKFLLGFSFFLPIGSLSGLVSYEEKAVWGVLPALFFSGLGADLSGLD